MSTLAPSPLTVETINSNHPGSEFGVIHLADSDTQMTLGQCLALLAEDGWSTRQEIPCAEAGMHKFLVSRKK
jgi:hypothetical protein